MTDTPETTTPKTLTKAEWAEAKGIYEAGKMTKVDLAKKFGVSRITMTNGLNGMGAVWGARSKEIENATVEAAKGTELKLFEEIAEMKAKRRKSIEILDQLQTRTMGKLLQENLPLASKADEFRTLNTMIKNAKLVREELWAIYDLDRDPDGADEIPEFIVSEYTADEVDAINKQRLGIDPESALEAVKAEAEEAADDLDALLDDGD